VTDNVLNRGHDIAFDGEQIDGCSMNLRKSCWLEAQLEALGVEYRSGLTSPDTRRFRGGCERSSHANRRARRWPVSPVPATAEYRACLGSGS